MSDEAVPPGKPAVPAVARAVRVLEEVAAAPDGITLSALARAVGAPKSSCLAVCTTLVDTGLLVRSGAGRYQLGLKVVQLGRAYLARSDLATEFRRADEDLGLLPDDTIVLSVLHGREVTYIDTRPGKRPVAMHYEIGMRLPAHCTASGKSLLAALPPEQVTERYANGALETLTRHSISAGEELTAELERVRSRGYAIDDEETALGMICFGAAVLDRTGRPAGALSVSMVKAAVDASRAGAATRAILQLAQALTARLGGPARDLPAVEPLPWTQPEPAADPRRAEQVVG
jgi:DNA-binding IclR family transcriptional regulator